MFRFSTPLYSLVAPLVLLATALPLPASTPIFTGAPTTPGDEYLLAKQRINERWRYGLGVGKSPAETS